MKKILLILFVSILFCSFVSAGLWDDVVAYYDLDEGTGIATTEDKARSLHNGSLQRVDEADWEVGILGNCLNLDGGAGVWTAEIFNMTGYGSDLESWEDSFSISIWLNTSETTQTNYILAMRNNTFFELSANSGSILAWTHPTGSNDTGMDLTDGWQHYVFIWDVVTANLSYYWNGTMFGSVLSNVTTTPADLIVFAAHSQQGLGWNGSMDEIGIWNKTLTSLDVYHLYNNEIGRVYGDLPLSITPTLNEPAANQVFSIKEITFNATITPTNYNITNATFYIWNSTGEFNVSTNIITGQIANQTILNITNFTLGNYEWNVLGCGVKSDDATEHNCSFANANYSFTIGAIINAEFWENETYETAREIFQINITLFEGSTLHSIKLDYNGTNYSVSDITNLGGNSYSFKRALDIPFNSERFQNDTKNFHWNFVFVNEEESQTYQITTERLQNSSFIVLNICNATYTQEIINFTLVNEITGIEVNGTGNNTDMKTHFNYWIGTGTTYKNYTYQNLTSNMSQYKFCIFPNWQIIHVDMNMEYSANHYSENEYYLRNSTLTNQTSEIDLFSLPSVDSTKFHITVQGGVDFLDNVIVTISKYFIGEGSFKTIGIKNTDNEGEFISYLEIDKTYRFSIVKDGIFYGIIEKKASCPTAPCEITLQVEGAFGDIFTGYYDEFAVNIVSNLSYNATSKIVTYQFLDITGLAQYFRLVVSKSSLNTTKKDAICDESLYSSSGSLTCNVTGYSGDFFAYGYVSRSPEQIDKIISFIISTIKESWGIMAIFFSLAIIVTLVFTAAVISRGNPAVIIFVFGAAILGLKLATIFPFSWIVVSVIELLVIFVMWEVKT